MGNNESMNPYDIKDGGRDDWEERVVYERWCVLDKDLNISLMSVDLLGRWLHLTKGIQYKH